MEFWTDFAQNIMTHVARYRTHSRDQGGHGLTWTNLAHKSPHWSQICEQTMIFENTQRIQKHLAHCTYMLQSIYPSIQSSWWTVPRFHMIWFGIDRFFLILIALHVVALNIFPFPIRCKEYSQEPQKKAKKRVPRIKENRDWPGDQVSALYPIMEPCRKSKCGHPSTWGAKGKDCLVTFIP